MADAKSKFSENHGWAMVIDRDGTIKYVENESDPTKVTASGVEEVLKAL